MATNSGHFKPGNRVFDINKMGLPAYWTDDKIKEEIESLRAWQEREDSVCMAGWRGEREITQRAVTYLRDKDSVFREAYEIAFAIVANRLAQKCGSGVNQAVFNRYQGYYDVGLKAHEAEIAQGTLQNQIDSNNLAKIAALISSGLLKQPDTPSSE